jgi:hypothetical protein
VTPAAPYQTHIEIAALSICSGKVDDRALKAITAAVACRGGVIDDCLVKRELRATMGDVMVRVMAHISEDLAPRLRKKCPSIADDIEKSMLDTVRSTLDTVEADLASEH